MQFLAGPREVRAGVMGVLLRLIAHISLVAAPLALLVLFHLQFLPYHHEPIAWWLRLAVVVDLVLVWMLWPSVVRGGMTPLSWEDFRKPRIAGWAALSLVPVLVVFAIATFPGEWLHSRLPALRLVPAKTGDSGHSTAWTWRSAHELLFGGDVDLVTRKPTSLWSNRLVLPGLDIGDGAKAGGDRLAGAFSLRGRHLEGAVLLDAHLKGVDFTAARLQGAYLNGADLREAKFACAERVKVADQAPEAPVRAAVAEQSCAQLEGAKLNEAHLQGSLLGRADLQGAALNRAELQGASLEGARLQGASFGAADLLGAKLDYAELQGADLEGADLTAASLTNAQLQGADLRNTRLEAANFDAVFVWRARISNSFNIKYSTYVSAANTAATYMGLDCPPNLPARIATPIVVGRPPRSPR